MKASEEITEEQSRQVCTPLSRILYAAVHCGCPLQLLFDVDHAYAEFFRSLSGRNDDAV